MYDKIDNCFIALGAVGLIVECVSHCFTPSYEERKKTHRELISDRIFDIRQKLRSKKISPVLEQKLEAIDFHFRTQSLCFESKKEEYKQLHDRVMTMADDTDAIYCIFNFLAANSNTKSSFPRMCE